MSWHPNDLLTDADLEAYEASILTQFGQQDWKARRTKAFEDWLFPILKNSGYDPYRLRTRHDSDAIQAYTSSVYTDKLSAGSSTSEDDINLGSVLATFNVDALYIGSAAQYRGVFLHLLDTVSSASAVLTVKYWNGAWEELSILDGTMRSNGKTLSGGGAVTWTVPVDWAPRMVNGKGPFYWVQLTVSAQPVGAVAGQIGVIRASALRAPVTFRTLQLIFQEAPTGADGPWREKAEFYKQEADDSLQRALGLVAGEFDVDVSDLIGSGEDVQTAEASGGGPFILERR